MQRYILTLLTLLAAAAFRLPAQPDTLDIPLPAARQLKWHEAELGVIFHYDLHVFDGQAYGQGSNRITPVEDYNIFAPEIWTRTSGYGRPRRLGPVSRY